MKKVVSAKYQPAGPNVPSNAMVTASILSRLMDAGNLLADSEEVLTNIVTSTHGESSEGVLPPAPDATLQARVDNLCSRLAVMHSRLGNLYGVLGG